jgi:hypothetical protein
VVHGFLEAFVLPIIERARVPDCRGLVGVLVVMISSTIRASSLEAHVIDCRRVCG